MYYVCKPSKIQIYVNTGRKTTAQIKRETGCDIIINGGIYNMSSFVPYCWLKADGKLLATDHYTYFGYGWSANNMVMDSSDNIAKYQNFIACVAMLKDGKKLELIYDRAMGGKRGRTAIGVRANGDVVVYCSKDGNAYALTPEDLQKEMQTLGCTSALMLDGGLSSQCIMPNGTITTSRDGGVVAIHNYILIWLDKEPEKPVANPQCPYTEPTHNIRWGSIGNGAKWVQWMLNRFYLNDVLDVDGLFFTKSVTVLKCFQKESGLAQDGVCGPLTREALKK